jgi:c-di-GMP-binding flagellar brake protein YcgR
VIGAKAMEEKRLYTRFTVGELDVQTARISRAEVDIHDISPVGISIIGPKKLRIGKQYLVRFGSTDRPVEVKGTVKWEMLTESRKISEEEVLPVYMAGLEFSDVLAPGATAIVDFITRSLEQREQRVRGIRFKIITGEKAVLDCVETYVVKIISLGGMLIEAGSELPVGAVYTMELFLSDDDGAIPFNGRIAYCGGETGENVTIYRVGIEFSGMPEEGKSRLEEFTKSLKCRDL